MFMNRGAWMMGNKLLKSLFIATPIIYFYGSHQNKSVQCQKSNHYHLFTKDQLLDVKAQYKNLKVLEPQYVEHIITHIRNENTNTKEFRIYADRLIRILLEYTLAGYEKQQVIRQSPMGIYTSFEIAQKDEEAGNSFLKETLQLIPGASVGQILIQRDEQTSLRKLFYEKLPKQIQQKKILLVDPMLATGGSAAMAIQVLKNHGVQEKDIIFLNLIACKEGIKYVFQQFPDIQIISAQIDPKLLPNINYIAPGMGDFGDRYFGTQ